MKNAAPSHVTKRGKGHRTQTPHGHLLGDDLLRRAGHRTRSLYLGTLALGDFFPFAGSSAKTAASYGTQHTWPNDRHLVAIAREWNVGPYGLAVLITKAAWERWRADRASWSCLKSRQGSQLRPVLDKSLQRGEFASFVAACGDAIRKRMCDILGRDGAILGIIPAGTAQVDLALTAPADVTGDMVGKDGGVAARFSAAIQTGDGHDKRGGSEEMKAYVHKSDARDIFVRFLDLRIGHPGSPLPLTYDDLVYRPDNSGRRPLYRDTLRMESRKAQALIIQVSLCVTSRDGWVAVIDRDKGKGRAPGRISSGVSLLHSFSPNPDKPLRGQITAFCREHIPGSVAGYPIKPIGVMLNEVNIDAEADGSASPAEKPSYLFFLAELDIGESFPPGFSLVPTAPKDLHADVTALRKVTDLSVQSFKNHGDRAAFLAVRHAGTRPVLGSGSAWLVDVRHTDMRRWADPVWPETTA